MGQNEAKIDQSSLIRVWLFLGLNMVLIDLCMVSMDLIFYVVFFKNNSF